MDFEEIKNLIEIDGGKFIIVENGKPSMVIVSFEEYKSRLLGRKAVSPAKKETRAVKTPVPKELENEELRVEDLPL